MEVESVACWTDTYSHFGCQDTSVVEGIHSKIKKWIQSTRVDLLTVFQKLHTWRLVTVKKLGLQVTIDATITPHRLQDDRYSAVVHLVTVWAPNETESLWKEARTIVIKGLPRSRCSGVFKRVHDWPCLHDFIRLTEANGTIKLLPNDFDRHWLVCNPGA